jgi:proteasome accessory factor C
MNVTGRINRILFILSYVSQNQGITVDSLAQKVAMRPKALLKELEFISLIGKPPFKPDDYVDIYVEEDRVFIEFDQSLNRPLRFTRSEAVSLLVSLELLDPELDPQGIKSLQGKIEDAISKSVDVIGPLQELVILEKTALPVSEHFRQIKEAVESRIRLEIEYFSMASNRKSRRVIRPFHLMNRLGAWYVTGFCEKRQDLRTFRFERVLSVKTLDSSFEPPEDFDLDKYRSDFGEPKGEETVEIQFDREVAPWIRERWGDATRDSEDGGTILTLQSSGLEFPSRLVLSYAPHATPLRPKGLIDKVREDAHEIIRAQGEEG